jgi:hypothetical protein
LQHLFLPFQVRRLKEFGVTMGEMTRYMDALIKDSEQLAMMIDSVPSVDNLDFIMESDALGHTVMDQLQGHESLLAVAETVTLEEVPSFFCICTNCCRNDGMTPITLQKGLLTMIL